MNQSDPGRARIFLGAPSTLTPEQRAVLEDWVHWLERRSCHVVRLEREGHGDDPWRTLIRRLSDVDGVVLLGFRQLDARDSVWRPGTDEEARTAGWWTSPWLQLEAGMAVALSLPVLVAAEDGVAEGVFGPGARNGQVIGAELDSPGAAADGWLRALRSRLPRRE